MKNLFDQAVFHTLCSEIGEADSFEALRVFLADTASKLPTLAALGEDRALIRREAHSVKSAAATFGFDDLSRLARELELGAETLASDRLRDSVMDIQRVFAVTRKFAIVHLLGTEVTNA